MNILKEYTPIILDDQLICCKTLERRLLKLNITQPPIIFQDPGKWLNYINGNKEKKMILFIDGDLNGVSGITLRSNLNLDIPSILVTGYLKYMGVVWDHVPDNFIFAILKDTMNEESILQALKRVLLTIKEEPGLTISDWLTVKNKSKTAWHNIELNSISYFECDNKEHKNYLKVYVYGNETSYLFHGSLASALSILPKDFFTRCNGSNIVGFKFIEMVDDMILMSIGPNKTDSLSLTLSPLYKSEFMKWFKN